MRNIIFKVSLGLALVTNACLAQEAQIQSTNIATNGAQSLSFREKLINNEQVEKLIAVDEYHSHVIPTIPAFGLSSGSIPADLTKFIISSCDTKWQTKGFDSLTSKVGWVPYDGKSDLYTREIEDKVTKEKQLISGARCVDRFEIVEVWGEWRSRFSDGKDKYFAPTNFLIKHNTPQPFKYKDSALPENVTMLPEGEVSSLTPGKTTDKGLFAKLLGNDKPQSADMFQYAVALCNVKNGKARAIANEGEFVADHKGRFLKENQRGYWKSLLVEEPLAEVYKHAIGGSYFNNGIEKEWYFACEGNSSFVARERENIKFDNNDKPHSSTSDYFAPDRGLDGVDFVSK